MGNMPGQTEFTAEEEKSMRGANRDHLDMGEVEDRGPSKANPAPSEADWRGSKFKKDRDFYSTKVQSPVGEGTQKEISGTIANDLER